MAHLVSLACRRHAECNACLVKGVDWAVVDMAVNEVQNTTAHTAAAASPRGFHARGLGSWPEIRGVEGPSGHPPPVVMGPKLWKEGGGEREDYGGLEG